METYDNSHLFGKNAVGGMIVFNKEGFDKSAYRKFNIDHKNITPGDDYGMMRQVLDRRFGADGLKTGYLSISGYGLAASAKNDNRRLIVVGHGFTSPQKRSQGTARLLNWGFREYTNINLFSKGETIIEADVWLGKKDSVEVHVNQDVYKTIKKAKKK